MPLIEPVARCRKFNSLDLSSAAFYLQLKTILDVSGRHLADPQILKSALFPLKDSVRSTDIPRWLALCQKAGLLRCYPDSEGRSIVEVFDARQKGMKFSTSKLEPPGGQQALFAESPPKQKRTEEKRTEPRASVPPVVEEKRITPPAYLATGQTLQLLSELQERIGAIYRRPAGSPWSDGELSTLSGISRRVGVVEELEHIIALRRSMPAGDRSRFFPQSVMKLVTNWNETLDKARVQCPQGAPKHQVQSPKPSVSIQPPTLEELESSLKWIQENPTPNNREHVASLEARIMEMKRK